MRHFLFSLLALAFALAFVPFAPAQVADPAVAASAPIPGAGHHYIGMGTETVSPADGLLSFDLPIQTPQGRQLSFPFGFRYSSSEQSYLTQSASSQTQLIWLIRPYTAGEQGGWSDDLPILTAAAKVQSFYTTYTGQPPQGAVNHQCDSSLNYVFRGFDGVQYGLNLGWQWVDPNYNNTNPATQCNTTHSASSIAHGITATAPDPWNSLPTQPPITVSDHSGTTYQFGGPLLPMIVSTQI